MLTPQQEAFRDRAVELARRVAPDYDLDWRLLAAAAILESGWGQSQLAREANNLFGIRAVRQTPESAVFVLHAADGPQRFRRYETDEEAFHAYGRLVGRSKFYEKARREAQDARLRTFVTALAPVYCPDDPGYALKILQIAALLR